MPSESCSEKRSPRLHAPGTVAVVETNIDDLNPQFYETAMERLFAAGALDVFLTPIQMKKNRPGTLLSVIWRTKRDGPRFGGRDPGRDVDLGVRISRWERICLERRWEEVATEFRGHPDQDRRAERRGDHGLPEYEDCKRAAAEHRVPLRQVYESAAAFHRIGGSQRA